MKLVFKSWLVLLLANFALLQTAHARWPDAVYKRVGADSGRVLAALKNNDTVKLARFVDPRRGVRFSPYISIDDSDVKRTRAQVRLLKNSPRKYVWGATYGEGGPMRLNWRDYRKRYVWNRDYTRIRPEFDAFSHRGNTINNLRKAYPNAICIEYFFPPRGENVMDWSSLWLIWQPTGKTWFLSGIAHDEWSP